MQEIEQRSEGVWRPSPGSVYPALSQLEAEGLVRAEESDGRRLFHLTEAGRAHVAEHRDELGAPWDALADEAGESALELRRLFGQLAAATMEVLLAGDVAQAARAREILVEARRSLYRILADDDPGDPPAA
jgi:DNA-binding PadR family transcriptional regulator